MLKHGKLSLQAERYQRDVRESRSSPAQCSPAGPTFPVAIDKDEFRAIENLAWMVRHSRQNVGLRMLDAAESVIKILKSKKPENSD